MSLHYAFPRETQNNTQVRRPLHSTVLSVDIQDYWGSAGPHLNPVCVNGAHTETTTTLLYCVEVAVSLLPLPY